jgi:hypothetical protein
MAGRREARQSRRRRIPVETLSLHHDGFFPITVDLILAILLKQQVWENGLQTSPLSVRAEKVGNFAMSAFPPDFTQYRVRPPAAASLGTS